MTQSSDKAERFLRHLEPLQGALEGFCRRCLDDPNSVEDVLQSSVGKAFRDFDLFAEGTNFRAWMFKYLNFEILAVNRQLQTRRHVTLAEHPMVTEDDWQLDVDESLLETLLDSPETILNHCDQALADAVVHLRPQERSVLLLNAIGAFKYREIAEILSVPMGTVMSSLARARERVRQELATFRSDQGGSMPQPPPKSR